MGETVRIERGDGSTLGGYRADPQGETTGGAKGKAKGNLVVLQEIFGVNHHVQAVCDGYAAAGYRCLAPALFDRAEPDLQLGYDDAGRTRGIELMRSLPQEDVLADIAAALAALPPAKSAVVGFCWGGSLAWASAQQLGDRLACAIGYYGGAIAKMLEPAPRCPVQLHFGETDGSIPLDDVERIRAAHPAVEIHVYEGGHAFSNADRPSFVAASAKQAEARSLAFLERHL